MLLDLQRVFAIRVSHQNNHIGKDTYMGNFPWITSIGECGEKVWMKQDSLSVRW